MKNAAKIIVDGAIFRGEGFITDWAIEECSELIQALQKLKRDRVKRHHVCAEIADVELAMEALKVFFDDWRVSNAKDVKLLKIKQRVEEDKDVARKPIERPHGLQLDK